MNKTPIYVAGKWADKALIRAEMKKFNDSSFQITHDWTSVEDSKDYSRAQLGEFANLDIEGVVAAKILVICVTDPNYAYRGTCTELGVALALGKRIALIDPFPDSGFSRNIFTKQCTVIRYKTSDEFIAAETSYYDPTSSKNLEGNGANAYVQTCYEYGDGS